MKSARFLYFPEDISQLDCADSNILPNGYVIEKVVEISSSEYDDFTHNLRAGCRLIGGYAANMYIDQEGIFHCVLVTISGAVEGILVEWEQVGCNGYAAYWQYK